uniref:Uncharacterized protein n=1 Tax=Klebsiella pneumoniae TaxID=573 RepID=A0A455TLV0_KLEPN|nr:hypothetical protein [Klebsiella pneumoniae]
MPAGVIKDSAEMTVTTILPMATHRFGTTTADRLCRLELIQGDVKCGGCLSQLRSKQLL